MITQPCIFKIKWQYVWGSIPGCSQKVVCSMYFALESYIFWPCQLTIIKNTGLILGLEKDVLAWKPLVQAPLKPDSTRIAVFGGCQLQVVPCCQRGVSGAWLQGIWMWFAHTCTRKGSCSANTFPWHELLLLLAGLQGVSVSCNSAGFRCS